MMVMVSAASFGQEGSPIPYAFAHRIAIYDADLKLKAPKNEEELNTVLRMAQAGDPEASILIWRLYTHHMVPESERKYAEGMKFLENALVKYPANGKLNLVLGNIYRGQLGIKENSAKALSYYEKAGSYGEPLGYGNIGTMYVHGLGVAQDIDKAYVYFQKAAAGGDAEAELIVRSWDGFLKMYVKRKTD